MTAFKKCAQCGERFGRAQDRSDRQWEAQRFCSKPCSGMAKRLSADEFVESPRTHCWEWQLALASTGYGVLKAQPAHRAYYEELVGPIPEGLVIDHLCRNPRCVNPGHLEPVTTRENILRGESRAAQNARKTHCQNGHLLDGANLYIEPRTGFRQCRLCKTARNTVSQRKRRAKARMA